MAVQFINHSCLKESSSEQGHQHVPEREPAREIGVFEIDKAGRILVVWPAACSMENNDGESYPIFIANSIIPA